MMFVRYCFALLSLMSSLTLNAQEYHGTVRDSLSKKALAMVSVVAYDHRQQPVCFKQTDRQGNFSLSVPQGKQAESIVFTKLGYAKKALLASKYKNGQTIFLKEEALQIREVQVSSRRLRQANDTLVYSVAGFRQKQDRTIADVIAKMPGLDVSSNGSITYQGKAINKFYIEGLDLMGSKYSMASKNLSADKVKNVEVIQNHQPVKTLKNIQFSDQAAINLVLTDDARNAWNGVMNVGVGAQMQKGEGEDVLRNGKALAMMFSKKFQSITMYKWDNTGKDIQQEVLDLSRTSNLSDEDNQWVSGISTGSEYLALQRYNLNDTHLAATNWLRKLGKDQELRLQSTYLFDKTIGKQYERIEYLNIQGNPVVQEESNASNYRSELSTEMQYKKNTDKLYINNIVRTSFDWNHDHATSMLDQVGVSQYVRLRKAYVGDELNIIKNIHENRSVSFNLLGQYMYQPSLLTLMDSTRQHLAITSKMLQASTSFRHKVWGFNITYETKLKYNRQDVQQGASSPTKDYNEEVSWILRPIISYKNTTGLTLDGSVTMNLAHYSITLQNRSVFQPSFTGRVGYKFSGNSEMKVGARTYYTPMPFRMSTSMFYYSNYRTLSTGTGMLEDMKGARLWGEYNYANPLSGVFFHVSSDYTSSSNMPVFEYSINTNIYTSQFTGQYSDTHRWTLAGDISKSFGLGKLTLDLGGDASWNSYKMLFDKELTPCMVNRYSAFFDFAIMPIPLFSIEEKSTWHYSKQKYNDYPSLNRAGLSYFQHDLRIFFMPGNWQIEWKNELYHSNDESVNTAVFSDLSVSYRTKKYEIGAILNNIFGTREYKRQYISDYYILYSVNQLRPREILCKVAFNL